MNKNQQINPFTARPKAPTFDQAIEDLNKIDQEDNLLKNYYETQSISMTSSINSVGDSENEAINLENTFEASEAILQFIDDYLEKVKLLKNAPKNTRYILEEIDEICNQLKDLNEKNLIPDIENKNSYNKNFHILTI